MVLTLPNKFPSLNKIIKASKAHWAVYAKLKKSCTLIVKCEIAEQDFSLKSDPPFSFSFFFFSKHKRVDPDNLAAGAVKMIFDGLVSAGVLENDGWKQVHSIHHWFMVDKKNPRIEVRVTPQSTWGR